MKHLLVLLCIFGCCNAFTIADIFTDLMDMLLSPIRGIQKGVRLLDIPDVPTKPVVFAKNKPSNAVYDFVVIGMSPGGCVVTNRLTENPEISVLILEAGTEDNVLTDIPLLNPYVVLTDYNWYFPTEYSGDVCQGMTHGICPWPAGKGPGGGTILNGMIYTRGNYRDFDSWANEGNPGWSYKDVLPYFIKVENMRINDLRWSKYHGTSGNLPITYPPFVSPLFEAFMSAGRYFGYKEVDYNDPNSHIGFSQIQSTSNLGERTTAAKAYLNPIRDRNNFEVSMKSRATKILIDPITKRAYGVMYVKDGKQRVVYARKEVILAAGAFNTPQVLMLSGIGPAYHLEDIGIPVLEDLPVGDNLMEHLGMHGLVFIVNKPVTFSPFNIAKNVVTNSLNYIVKSRGVLSSLGVEAMAYMKSKYSNSTEDYPDIELILVPSGMNEDAGYFLRKAFGISDELYEYTYKGIDGLNSFSIWPMTLYPESRGYVRLKDSNPLNKVRIHHNFLKAPIDIKILVEAVKYAVLIAESPPFRKFGTRLHHVPFPQCANIEFRTDEYWECAIRVMTTQYHHQSGTCKMGDVVDSRLRVKGIQSLRVVDVSILPSITGGHTQAPAYMIGEKASDFLKQEWKI